MFKLFKKNPAYILLSIVFFLGGTGFYIPWASTLGIGFSLVGILVLLLKKRKILFPKYIKLIFALFTFLLISFSWSVDLIQSYNFFILVFSGFLFYLLSYNFDLNLNKLLIGIGLVFALIYTLNLFLTQPFIYSLSIPFYSVVSRNHSHIGDFWVIISLISGYGILQNRKKVSYWYLLILSLFIVAVSFSRAAYFSLAAGVSFIAYRKDIFRKYKKLFYIFSAVFFVMFFAVATKKSIISSRPYFIQSLVGALKYPFGVGLGNFGFVSRDESTHLWEATSFSFYTHNLILEFLTAIGIFSVFFISWVYKIFKGAFEKIQHIDILAFSILISLSVNFLFDYTYFVPTLIWVWFSFLGLVQSQAEIKKE